MDTNLLLYFRISNVEKALDYIKNCPERVLNTFLVSDKGCQKRGTECVSGITYTLQDKTIWRCGCCNPNFQAVPLPEDYIYYINAAEIGIYGLCNISVSCRYLLKKSSRFCRLFIHKNTAKICV